MEGLAVSFLRCWDTGMEWRAEGLAVSFLRCWDTGMGWRRD